MGKQCKACKGTGIEGIEHITCPDCQGHGLKRFYARGYGEAIRRCERCDGHGTVANVKLCPSCKGLGFE